MNYCQRWTLLWPPWPSGREPLGGKLSWCFVKLHREPELHQSEEKQKLLQSCTGSHSNTAVPIFKNLKDSKNIKSEGKKLKNSHFYQKEKNAHAPSGSSDETTYG